MNSSIFLVTIYYDTWDKGTRTETCMSLEEAETEFDLLYADKENDGSDAIWLCEIDMNTNQVWMKRSWKKS